jgi:hypothetical protein
MTENRIDQVNAFLSERTRPTTISEIARKALGIPYEDRRNHNLSFVSKILKLRGWRRYQSGTGRCVERWFAPAGQTGGVRQQAV